MKNEREEIFKLFLDQTELSFAKIEKSLKIKSNMLAYHLEKMQTEGLVKKEGLNYKLTKNGEKYIPVFTHVVGQELSPLPVVLVALMHKDKLLLIKRNKRPYKDYWSLIGGKMLLEETFETTCLRLVKEKSGLDGKYESINVVLHERVEDEGTIKHSFILFFTKMKTLQTKFEESEHGELKWFNLKDIEKEKVIPSDLWLIKHKLNARISLKTVLMQDKEGELSSFKIV